MNTENSYFQFPLFLLRDLFKDKNKTLNDILRYGLYSFAEKIQPNIDDVIRQMMYCYYRKQNDLPNKLLKLIEYHIEEGNITIDEDYNGFDGSEFNPDADSEIRNLFLEEPNFYNMAFDWYRIQQSYKYFNVNGNYQNAIDVGSKIHSSIPAGEPMPMINKNQLFEFRDKEKTEFELMKFAVNIGIRSIIGKKDFIKTNKQMILCRTFGYKSNNNLPKKMPVLFYKYSKRYQIDKVLQSLELENWNLQFYSNHIRGMYIAFKNKISIDKLAEIAETKKMKNRIQDLKNTKKEATKKALNKIA